MASPFSPLARPYRLHTIDRAPTTLSRQVVACIEHSSAPGAPDDDPRRIHVPLPVLKGPSAELWETDADVQSGWEGPIGYAHSDTVLFAQLRVSGAAMNTDARKATTAAYAALHAFFAARADWHWVRTWNYIGNIHRGDDDAERYRQFNLGRYDVIGAEPDFERRLPAATAIGTPGDDLLIYVLSTRQAGEQIENPRQVSAFRYPRQYGPQSPSFSRARRLDWQDGTDLIVSGTASIVGHATTHVDDPSAQLQEIFANLRELRGQAHGRQWQTPAAKLFVRNAQIYDSVRQILDDNAEVTPQALSILQGDICRRDLALEIEVLFQR